jgi:hypothetical protein
MPNGWPLPEQISRDAIGKKLSFRCQGKTIIPDKSVSAVNMNRRSPRKLICHPIAPFLADMMHVQPFHRAQSRHQVFVEPLYGGQDLFFRWYPVFLQRADIGGIVGYIPLP